MTRILSALTVLALLAACGGGPAITADDLGTIMPSAADAPAGTTIQAEQSGPKTLAEFVGTADVRTKLRDLGFKVGYVATFTNPNLTDDLTEAPAGTLLYGAFAVVLDDEKAAEDGIAFYQKRVRTRSKDATPVLETGLGEDSFAYRFSSLEDTPLPGVVHFWRVGNALFSVVGVGNPGPDPAVVRRLASTIDSRAKKV